MRSFAASSRPSRPRPPAQNAEHKNLDSCYELYSYRYSAHTVGKKVPRREKVKTLKDT